MVTVWVGVVFSNGRIWRIHTHDSKEVTDIACKTEMERLRHDPYPVNRKEIHYRVKRVEVEV